MTALQPPSCCIICEEAPNNMRRKCWVLPPVTSADTGVTPPLWPEALIESTMTFSWSWTSASCVGFPAKLASTTWASSWRSLVRSQRGLSGLDGVSSVSSCYETLTYSRSINTSTMMANTHWNAIGKRQTKA